MMEAQRRWRQGFQLQVSETTCLSCKHRKARLEGKANGNYPTDGCEADLSRSTDRGKGRL